MPVSRDTLVREVSWEVDALTQEQNVEHVSGEGAHLYTMVLETRIVNLTSDIPPDAYRDLVCNTTSPPTWIADVRRHEGVRSLPHYRVVIEPRDYIPEVSPPSPFSTRSSRLRFTPASPRKVHHHFCPTCEHSYRCRCEKTGTKNWTKECAECAPPPPAINATDIDGAMTTTARPEDSYYTFDIEGAANAVGTFSSNVISTTAGLSTWSTFLDEQPSSPETER